MRLLYCKLDILFRVFLGLFLKIKFLFVMYISKRVNLSSQVEKGVVVSLTSYGRRTKSCSPFAVFSILSQITRPEKVVLWLDEKIWNDENIPTSLKFLKRNGLLINYCEDIGPYTKLLPALKCYPQKAIITVDDDIWYSEQVVSRLVDSYKNNNRCIHTLGFKVPKHNKNTISPYSNWKEIRKLDDISLYNKTILFPQGVGGVLYPPDIFSGEIFNHDVFKKLCPYADDIWFFCMALKDGIEIKCVKSVKISYYILDLFQQILHKDMLRLQNVNENQNDIQLRQVLSYYNLKIETKINQSNE